MPFSPDNFLLPQSTVLITFNKFLLVTKLCSACFCFPCFYVVYCHVFKESVICMMQ